jgi:hypothetical protein
VAVSDYDNKWISIHEPGGKFLTKIGSNKVLKNTIFLDDNIKTV